MTNFVQRLKARIAASIAAQPVVGIGLEPRSDDARQAPSPLDFNSDLLKSLVREGRAQHRAKIQSVVSWQAEALIELIDQRIEDVFISESVFRPSLIDKAFEYLPDILLRLMPLTQKKRQRSLLEVAQRRDLALQKAAAVFEHPHAVLDGFTQRTSSTSGDESTVSPARPDAHRLSGGAK